MVELTQSAVRTLLTQLTAARLQLKTNKREDALTSMRAATLAFSRSMKLLENMAKKAEEEHNMPLAEEYLKDGKILFKLWERTRGIAVDLKSTVSSKDIYDAIIKFEGYLTKQIKQTS